jgi:hypothetical protein
MDVIDDTRLANATARYAAYSRSAGGLGLVVGGVLCFLTFLVGAAVELTPWLRGLLACAPLAWLATKEAVRRWHYQRAGRVLQRLDRRQWRNHLVMVAYLLLVAGLVLYGVISEAGAAAWQWPVVGYVVLVAALPLAAARWFWSTGDFLVGVLLFCQAAVVLVGLNYPWYWVPLSALFAAIAIRAGWREHRAFAGLEAELGLAPAPADAAR